MTVNPAFILLMIVIVGGAALVAILVEARSRGSPDVPSPMSSCPTCGEPVDEHLPSCPMCGQPLEKSR
jgi:hypothetical protein